MKGYIILILISLSLATAVVLQSRKTVGDTLDNDMRRIGKALAPLHTLLPPSCILGYMGEPANPTPYVQARYILAPCVLNVTTQDAPAADTLLAIQYIYSGDSALQHYVSARRQLWQYTDDRYRYTITINR